MQTSDEACAVIDRKPRAEKLVTKDSLLARSVLNCIGLGRGSGVLTCQSWDRREAGGMHQSRPRAKGLPMI